MHLYIQCIYCNCLVCHKHISLLYIYVNHPYITCLIILCITISITSSILLVLSEFLLYIMTSKTLEYLLNISCISLVYHTYMNCISSLLSITRCFSRRWMSDIQHWFHTTLIYKATSNTVAGQFTETKTWEITTIKVYLTKSNNIFFLFVTSNKSNEKNVRPKNYVINLFFIVLHINTILNVIEQNPYRFQ